jgi:hypothetical protein
VVRTNVEAEPSGEEEVEAKQREQAPGDDRRRSRSADAPGRDRAPPEDEQWVESHVEEHGDRHQDHRRDRVSDAVQQGGHDEGGEHDGRTGVDDLQVGRACFDEGGLGAHQHQDGPSGEVAADCEQNRESRREDQDLPRGRVGFLLSSRAHVLRDERDAGDGDSATDGDSKEDQRPGEPDGGETRRAVLRQPEAIDEVVDGLEQVRHHHRPGKSDE